jgi:hypothetical protein
MGVGHRQVGAMTMIAFGGIRLLRPGSGGAWLVLCAAALIALAAAAQAQTAPQPISPERTAPVLQPQQQPPQPAPAARPPQKDGFFDALGRWWDKGVADFKANVDESNAKWRELGKQSDTKWRELGQQTGQAVKDAGDALAKIPGTRIIEGRQRCEVAPNGSPDCNAAATVICKGKGFAEGKSVDIQQARKCSARAWLSSSPADSECTTETIVIKAACQ